MVGVENVLRARLSGLSGTSSVVEGRLAVGVASHALSKLSEDCEPTSKGYGE